jgi:hypothetical protein
MKRLLLSAAAVSIMGLAPMAAFAGSSNSGYTAGLGIAAGIDSGSSTTSYGSVDGGGNTTNGKVYATSQSSDNTGASQSFGLNGSAASSYDTQQGSGEVNGNDKASGTYTGGVDFAAGGTSTATGGYALSVDAYGTEYENKAHDSYSW